MAKPVMERFNQSYLPEPNSGCWLWIKHISKSCRYGLIKVNGRSITAHRFSYINFVGDIPEGMNVCHKCDIASCVNPNHLFLGTQKDNHDDMVKKGRRASFSGEKNGRSKLTKEQAIQIKSDTRAAKFIANEFGISRVLVGLIKNGRNWNV